MKKFFPVVYYSQGRGKVCLQYTLPSPDPFVELHRVFCCILFFLERWIYQWSTDREYIKEAEKVGGGFGGGGGWANRISRTLGEVASNQR